MGKDCKWLIDWQTEFNQQPEIYFTWDYKHDEPTGNYYDSEEAAQIEVNWAKNKGTHLQIFSTHIHSLKLSKDRWNFSKKG